MPRPACHRCAGYGGGHNQVVPAGVYSKDFGTPQYSAVVCTLKANIPPRRDRHTTVPLLFARALPSKIITYGAGTQRHDPGYDDHYLG